MYHIVFFFPSKINIIETQYYAKKLLQCSGMFVFLSFYIPLGECAVIQKLSPDFNNECCQTLSQWLSALFIKTHLL